MATTADVGAWRRPRERRQTPRASTPARGGDSSPSPPRAMSRPSRAEPRTPHLSSAAARWNPPEEWTWRPVRGLAMCATSIIVMTWLTLSLVGDLAGEARTPRTGIAALDWALRDEYYSRALPVLIPGTIAYVYFHWLSARFFEHT